MPTNHAVAEGETIIGIAHKHGFRDWRVIYFDAVNAELRKLRPNPDVLKAGDTVVIPDKQPVEFQAQTNKRHTFTIVTQKAHFEVVLEDEEGEPYAGKRFKLVVNGVEHEGLTSPEGEVDVLVPPDAPEGELTLWPDDADPKAELKWTVQLAAMTPLEKGETKGVRERLANLGYDTGPLDQEPEEGVLDNALADFAEAHDLEEPESESEGSAGASDPGSPGGPGGASGPGPESEASESEAPEIFDELEEISGL